LLVIATVCLGAAQATGQTAARPAPAPAPAGQTNGPLAYQDAVGQTVRLTAIGAKEPPSAPQAAGTITFPIKDATTPVWSPSGSRLAFTRRVGGRRQIFVTDEGKADVRQVTKDSAEAFDPTWSPTGRRLAFTSTRHGDPEIYTIGIDGDDEQRLTFAGGRQPDWSPAGDQIAFTSRVLGGLDIWIANADGSGFRPVTSAEGAEVDPEWRPDGSGLAFVRVTATRSHVFVIRPDGTQPRALTRGAVTDRFPAWAPTGGAIAFTRIKGRDRSTRVVSTSNGAKSTATRLEIEGGVRADWGALPVPPSDPKLLAGTTAVTPVSGSNVSVTLPASTQPADLAVAGARVPDGSVVRAPTGNPVALEAAAPGTGTGSAARSVQAQVTGTFAILPPDRTGEADVTLGLRGGAPDCTRGAGARSAATKKPKSRGRKAGKKISLTNGGGKVRAIGKHASGLTKRTIWSMEETCAGTLTIVQEGQVEVRDVGRRRTILVSAGERYLARAR